MHRERVPARVPQTAPTKETLAAWGAVQRALATEVRLEDDFEGPRTLGGFDVAYDGDVGYGALVLLDARTLETLAVRTAAARVDVPYVPTFLGFRELPVLEALWAEAPWRPDVLFVDGSGVLHPRRLGTAAHVGVALDQPTVGVTKSWLFGTQRGRLRAPGDAAPVEDGGQLLGHAFWSSARAARPVYVSPGHRVSVATSLALARAACRHARLPEPIRVADEEAGRAKRAALARARGAAGEDFGPSARSDRPRQARLPLMPAEDADANARRRTRHDNATAHGRYGTLEPDEAHLSPEVPPIVEPDVDDKVPEAQPGALPENEGREERAEES